ncbi:MAG: hypothetical protein Kow00121_41310 [Elainellaceae cyanobacterium]
MLSLLGLTGIGYLAIIRAGLDISFTSGEIVVGDVPLSIVALFLQDETARTAYLQGDRQQLHARLQTLGVEERIKAFYRPQFQDEIELDRYIHQIFYDRTGYVGLNYRVDANGQLVFRENFNPNF